MTVGMQKVYVSGAAVASPISRDWEAFCRLLSEGSHCFRKLQPHPDLQERYFAFFEHLPKPNDPSIHFRFTSKLSRLALFLTENVLASANLKKLPAKETGIYFGSAFSNLHDLEAVYEVFFKKGPHALSPLSIPLNMAITPAGHISIHHGIQGPIYHLSSACASGSQAIKAAFESIQSGTIETAICGGLDLMNNLSLISAWEKMRVLSLEKESPQRVCMPFHKNRKGFSLGEGGALFLLESESFLLKRKGRAIAEIESASENSNGHDIVKPSAKGAALVMRKALEKEGLPSSSIDAIQTHGTATLLNDQAEAKAMKAVFGDHLKNISISANKASIGHTMGASGAFSFAAALGTLYFKKTYPLKHVEQETLDSTLNIDLKRNKPAHEIKRILINSFAFGGVNVSLIIKAI